VCDYRRGLDWWTDLSTTYTHHSELKAITAPPLISTIHEPPQRPLSFFQLAVCSPAVSWQRRLTVVILQLHALRFYLHSLPCTTQLIAPTTLAITSRHGPHRKHCSSNVACVFVAVGTCLPSCCQETGCVTPFVKNPVPRQRPSFHDRYTATGLHATLRKYIYWISIYLILPAALWPWDRLSL
jgi:hypothetical protein